MWRYCWECSLWLLALWEELKIQWPVSIAGNVAPHSSPPVLLSGSLGSQTHSLHTPWAGSSAQPHSHAYSGSNLGLSPLST